MELQNRDQKVCYLTSSKDDPILKNKNENVRVFYIGDSELEKMKFFFEIKSQDVNYDHAGFRILPY